MEARARTPAAESDVDQAAAAAPRLDPPAIARPIRIEPAFDNREVVRTLFDRHAPYRAVAAYLPDGSDDTVDPRPADSVNPWFRGTWALGGKVLIEGAEEILATRTSSQRRTHCSRPHASFRSSWS